MKCNFHYVAMLMMTSQILKFVDFTKTPKFRYLENKASKIMRSNYNQGPFYCKKKKFYSGGKF